jgi:UDP-N-acetylmuramoyl-tripeptide--D-alanyl-D-alanine ligase
MLSMSLQQAAEVTGGRLIGENLAFDSVSTDSRNLQGHPLFVALRGERFDAHAFLSQARDAGACALMLEQQADNLDIPQLLVADTRQALGRLAAAWRQGSATRVVGLTGSNGKTTLKEMLAAILRQGDQPVLATRGNLNNDIGLPLTLLRLRDEPLAVVEMGANHKGEIDYLSRLARPDVAVLNNAGRAHLEGFGSLRGVATAKAEILNGLSPDGCFVYHADSEWAPLWRELAGERRTLGFGLSPQAQVRGIGAMSTEWTSAGFSSHFEVQTPSQRVPVMLQLAGEHNRLNALAAIATAHCLGVPVAAMQRGLAEIAPVKGRLSCLRSGGVNVVDDSYNANPDSIQAAIDVMRGAPGTGFLVLGDMAELGEAAVSLHAQMGQQAQAAGIAHLYTVGPLSAAASEAFGQGGAHFRDQTQLIDALRARIQPGDTLLIKGSRSAAMDRVVDALTREKSACC